MEGKGKKRERQCALPKLEPECRHQLRTYPKAVFSPDRWRLSRDAKLSSFFPIQSYTVAWDSPYFLWYSN